MLFRSVPCAVCIFDDRGAILFQNEIFKQYFGTVIPPGDNKFAALAGHDAFVGAMGGLAQLAAALANS